MCVRVRERVRFCALLGDLTAGKLVIELLILSDLTARLAFLFHFMPLYIFFKLSCGRGGTICHPRRSADNTNSHDSQGHTHTHTYAGVHSNKPALHTSHIHTEDVTAARFVRSSDRADSAVSSHVAWRVSRQQDRRPGQQHLMPSPRLSHPCSLPPSPASPLCLTSSLTHCLSARRTGTLRRARQDER